MKQVVVRVKKVLKVPYKKEGLTALHEGWASDLLVVDEEGKESTVVIWSDYIEDFDMYGEGHELTLYYEEDN